MKNTLYHIPDSWSWTSMGEIADVVGGGTPKTNDPSNYEGGIIPWITPADLSGYEGKFISHGSRYITEKGLQSSSAKMMPAGTVLFTSRAPIGYVAIAKNAVCTNQGFKSFVLPKGISADFVYWYLRGNKSLAESYSSGTTFLELSGSKAKQLPIPIAPLPEQHRIVNKIEELFTKLDAAVEALKKAKVQLKLYRQAVLKYAFEGKLTQSWRADNLKGSSQKWESTTVKDLALKITDGEHLRPKTIAEGIYFLSAKDVRDNGVSFTDPLFVSYEDAERFRKRCDPERGDILVVSRGATVGRTCVVNTDTKFCLLGSVILIKPKPVVKSKFLCYSLMSQKGMSAKLR